MIELNVYGDGSCKNVKVNRETMGIGVVGYIGKYKVFEIAEYVGKGTSNIAEWEALITAVRESVKYVLKHYKNKVVSINYYSDSQVTVRIFTGIYSNKNFKTQYIRAKYWENKLLKNHRLNVSWIPREENTVADKLSKLGNPYFK